MPEENDLDLNVKEAGLKALGLLSTRFQKKDQAKIFDREIKTKKRGEETVLTILLRIGVIT